MLTWRGGGVMKPWIVIWSWGSKTLVLTFQSHHYYQVVATWQVSMFNYPVKHSITKYVLQYEVMVVLNLGISSISIAVYNEWAVAGNLLPTLVQFHLVNNIWLFHVSLHFVPSVYSIKQAKGLSVHQWSRLCTLATVCVTNALILVL